MYTSTLLVATDSARAVPWNADLKRHQDWDWLIRLQRAGTTIRQLPQPLSLVHTGSTGSISAGTDWRSSLAWADAILVDEAPGVMEDFLAAQTLRYALAARDFAGVSAVAARIRSRRRIPSFGSVLIGLAGLIPRSRLELLMTRFR